jgi:hypothetical protein
LHLDDPGVARVVEHLLGQRGRRLFTVNGTAIDSDEINARLAELTGAHLTAKDFRTWTGTVAAFRQLRAELPAGDDAETHVLTAVDTAAELLGNTRTVARAHYVHPDVIDGYTSGELAGFLAGRRMRASKFLDVEERLLLAYLSELLDRRAPEFEYRRRSTYRVARRVVAVERPDGRPPDPAFCSNISVISSTDMPFVSGTNMRTNRTASTDSAAKQIITQPRPIERCQAGKASISA